MSNPFSNSMGIETVEKYVGVASVGEVSAIHLGSHSL